MRADPPMHGTRVGYNIVVVTLDQHAAGPAARIAPRLTKDFPGLTISIHAAAEWAENPAALTRCAVVLGELRHAEGVGAAKRCSRWLAHDVDQRGRHVTPHVFRD